MRQHTQTQLLVAGALSAAIVVSYLLLDAQAPTAEPEKITLNFWSVMVPNDDATNAIVRNTQETIALENPDIKINFLNRDGDVYKAQLKAAIAAGETPDIFYTWLPGYAVDFVESGVVMKLNDHLSAEAKTHLNMKAVHSGNSAFDGIYALPIEVKMGVLYCNKQLFEQFSIKIPDTYEELLLAVDQFNAVGIQPILAPGKRVWPLMWLYDILAVKAMGSDDTIRALRKEASFNQPGFLTAASQLRELVDRGAFGQESLLLDNNDANDRFFQGANPMYFMGSWLAAAVADSSQAVAEHVTVRRFPVLGNEFDNHMLGGTGDGYMIAASSQHQHQALRILERYIQLMSESDAVLFPVWDVAKDYSNMPPIFVEINELYQRAEGFVIWWDTYLNSADAQTHKDLVTKLFAGYLSPEQYIEQMQWLNGQ